MDAVLTFAVFAFVIFLIAKKSKTGKQLQAIDQLAIGGVPARALALAASQFAKGITINGRRFEQRDMTLEVEIFGQPPYVIQDTFLVPRGLVEAIPGSSLELAVDPKVANKVSILGPGGFTGPWLNLGPPRPY